jgi:hypothetical protein
MWPLQIILIPIPAWAFTAGANSGYLKQIKPIYPPEPHGPSPKPPAQAIPNRDARQTLQRAREMIAERRASSRATKLFSGTGV